MREREKNIQVLKEKDHNFKIYQKTNKYNKEGNIKKEQDSKMKLKVTLYRKAYVLIIFGYCFFD